MFHSGKPDTHPVMQAMVKLLEYGQRCQYVAKEFGIIGTVKEPDKSKKKKKGNTIKSIEA